MKPKKDLIVTKSFKLTLLALSFVCVAQASAQSIESISASNFEDLCQAPNNQGAPIELVETLPFETLFSTSFPGALGQIKSLRPLATNQALAYQFVAPDLALGFSGYLMAVGVPGVSVMSSISACPGVFGAQLNSALEFCDGGSGKTQVTWKLEGQAASGLSSCNLVPGRTYFLNVGVNSCEGKDCSSRIVSRRFFE